MAIVLLLMMGASAFARNMPFVGGGFPLLQCQTATNSVFADVTIEDDVVVSHSSADTHLSFSPPASVRDFLPGTLTVSLSAVASCSNIVGVLFGNCDAPALAIECDGGWHILPPGAFCALDEPLCEAGVATNRIEVSLRVSATGKVSFAKVMTASCASALAVASDIAPPDFSWDGTNLPQFWHGFSVRVAGPSARLLGMSLRYSRDGTGMLVR